MILPERYAISLDLNGKYCLVVGGGQVAERKVHSLLECGARVKVVSPGISPELKDLVAKEAISYRPGRYRVLDLEGVFLVIGATDREKVNRQISDDCLKRNLLVNIVDDPAKGNFYVPATVNRGSLNIAISTGGKSPLLARKIREELEEMYGPQYGEFLDLLGVLRVKLLRLTGNIDKMKIMESFFNREIITLVKENRMDEVKERLRSAYCSSGSEPPDSPS
jgi:precorrin-2 dehydrogenase/sirohydrochlorin ferrochelatase